MRFVFVGALVAGWLGGVYTDMLQATVMYSSTFVGGAIIVTAIREEMPSNEEGHPLVFIASAIITSVVILTVQYLQSVEAAA